MVHIQKRRDIRKMRPDPQNNYNNNNFNNHNKNKNQINNKKNNIKK